MSASAIDEIEDRLRDLTEALREAGCIEAAQPLESFGREFTDPTRVRPSVNAIRARLQYWREHPEELPESARIMLAANRLEDVCREALAAGVIAVAPPTLGAKARRKLAVAVVTLLCGTLSMLIPVGLIRAGFDPDDWNKERKLSPRKVPRGEEDSIGLKALAGALRPEAVGRIEFAPLDACRARSRNGARCAQTSPRLWAEGRLPTYEIKLPHQTYGLLFSISSARMLNGVGVANLLTAATDETPEGHYEIPLTVTYYGYTPRSCELIDRVQDRCPGPSRGPGERHPGVGAPTVVVDVVPGDPSQRLGEKRRAQAEAAERRRKAEERAKQIGSALSQIDDLIAQTRKLVAQKRWEQVSERVQKLGTLFQPLDSMSLTQGESEALPADIADVRARFELLRDRLDDFEDQVFERTFTSVAAESNRKVAEESLLLRLGAQFHISKEYVERIYTSRADEIERRLKARAQAHLDRLRAEQTALEARCGPMPPAAWTAVESYVKSMYAEASVEVSLGECMTARLTERECWVIHCDFVLKREVAVELPKVVSKREADFHFTHQRIVGHRP
jgi:hypothetical protein